MTGITLNQDNSNYFFNAKSNSVSEIMMFIGQYENTQIDTIALNVNAMRTSYNSAVWDSIWDGYDPDCDENQAFFENVSEEQRKNFYHWVHNAWSINNEGIDIYKQWIQKCREIKVSPIISVRMNDVHSIDNAKHPMHSRFWTENPHLRRKQAPYQNWTDAAFDYLNEEVRNHYFSLIEELVQRYDFDGLELDWMRFPFHFKVGYEQEGRAVLTSFMTNVRNLLNKFEQKRGHKITLIVRIPSRPQTAYRMGFDFMVWAKQKLVDMLVVTPFFPTIDNDIPIELWKGLLDNTNVQIAAGLEVLVKAFASSKLSQLNSLETVRGSAYSLLSRGADKIYLFNYFGNEEITGENYKTMLNEIGDLSTLKGKPRRHIVTYADTVAPGEPQSSLLPILVNPEQYAQISIHTGQIDEIQTAEIILSSIEENALNKDNTTVFLNGEICEFVENRTMNAPKPEGFFASYKVPISAIKNGNNLIEISTNIHFTLCWAEMDFNY